MKLKRKLIIALGVLAGLVLVAAPLVLSRLSDIAASLRPSIQRNISEAIGGNVTFNEIKISLLPPSILLTDVRVADTETKVSSVKIGAIEARAEILPLLSRRLVVSALRLKQPEVTVVRDKEGASVRGIAKKPSNTLPTETSNSVERNTSSATGSIDLHVDSVSIADGSLLFDDKVSNKPILLKAINFSGKLKALSEKLQVSDAALSLIVANNAPYSLRVSDAQFEYASKGVALNGATLSTPAGTILLSTVSTLGETPLVLNLAAEQLSIKEMQTLGTQFVPSFQPLDFDGFVGVSLKLTLEQLQIGKMDGAVTLSKIKGLLGPQHKLSAGAGTININGSRQEVALDARRITASINDLPVELAAKARINPTSISLTELTVRGFGGSMTGAPVINLSPQPIRITSPFNARSLSLEPLLKFANNPLTSSLGGTIVSFSGDVSSLNITQPAVDSTVRGNLSFRDGVIKGLNIPEQILSSISSLPLLSEAIKKRLPPEVQSLTAKKDTALKELDASFKLSSGVVNISQLKAVSDLFSLTSSGTYNVNGEMNLDSQVTFNQQLSKMLLDRIPELKGLCDSGDRIGIPLLLKGRLPAVKVIPDLAIIAKKTSGGVLTKALESVAKGNNKKLNKTLNKIFGF